MREGCMPTTSQINPQEAKEKLNDLGLGIKKGKTESSDKYEEGQIISQNVDKGDLVKKNTTVTVVISSGAGDIEIPNVEGLDETSAINKLKDAGFKYSRDYQNSDSVASGDVISQSPSGGSSAKKGSPEG